MQSKQKPNQATKLLRKLSYDGIFYRYYLGNSQNDWLEKLLPSKIGFQIDGNFQGY